MLTDRLREKPRCHSKLHRRSLVLPQKAPPCAGESVVLSQARPALMVGASDDISLREVVLRLQPHTDHRDLCRIEKIEQRRHRVEHRIQRPR